MTAPHTPTATPAGPADPAAPATNWAGNLTFSASRWHRPSTVDELRRIVAGAARVHAVGSAHSFSPVADGPGELVSLAGLPPLLALDPESATVTVCGGVRYGELAQFLEKHGYALANLASLPHLTVAGAVATGTHGSGSHNPGLAAAVTGLDLVTASGDLLRLDRADADFAGAVVGLGALGVVSALTLAIEPTYQVSQWVYDALPVDRLTDSYATFAEVFGDGYSVSAFIDWTPAGTAAVWVKRRSDFGPPPTSWLGGVLADGPRHPIPGMPAQPCTGQLGVPGPWYERLPHFRLEFTPSSGEELQTEYLLPIQHGPAALRAVQTIRDRVAAVLQICEVRTIAEDDLWLSMAYQRDSVALHFTWQPDVEAVAPVLDELERLLAPYAPRPHWGKLFHCGPDELAGRYPRWADFAALRQRLDPAGKFGNAMIERYFPSGDTGSTG